MPRQFKTMKKIFHRMVEAIRAFPLTGFDEDELQVYGLLGEAENCSLSFKFFPHGKNNAEDVQTIHMSTFTARRENSDFSTVVDGVKYPSFVTEFYDFHPSYLNLLEECKTNFDEDAPEWATRDYENESVVDYSQFRGEWADSDDVDENVVESNAPKRAKTTTDTNKDVV